MGQNRSWLIASKDVRYAPDGGPNEADRGHRVRIARSSICELRDIPPRGPKRKTPLRRGPFPSI
jgi:hypothetical protein